MKLLSGILRPAIGLDAEIKYSVRKFIVAGLLGQDEITEKIGGYCRG